MKNEPVDSSLVLTSCNFGTKVGSTYTFSVYMKADRPGVRVRMYSVAQPKPYDKAGKEVLLSEDWKRYEYTYTRKNNVLYSDMLRIALLNKGVVWIDAVQLENGPAATAFQLADADRRLVVHEGNVEKELFQVPVHKTQLLNETPMLDGMLADAVWSKVPAVELKSVSGTDVSEKTLARIFYTDRGIYLGIDAQEAQSDQIKCSKKNRDEYVWIDPSFEIFLDSKLTRGTYHHLAFNTDGVQYDANLGETTWNGNWQVKTARKPDASGWTAEVFLPFSDLGIDRSNGPLWGFNLCRNNPRHHEISTWAPTYGGFHSPLRFGQLTISEEIQKKYFTGIRNAAVRYAGKDKAEVGLNVYNDMGKDAVLTVRSRLLNTKTKQIFVFEKCAEVPDKSEKNLILGTLSGEGDGTFLMETEILEGDIPLHYVNQQIASANLLAALVQYDYYTREKELEIRGFADLNDELLQRMILKIVIENEKKEVYRNLEVVGQRSFRKKIPISEWENGNYRMTACLMDTDKEKIAQTTSSFQKLAPADNEVKLDRFRRAVTCNGALFLPLGFFWEGALTPELVAFLGKSGVNTLHTYRYEELLKNPEILDAGLKYGVRFQIDTRAKKGETERAIAALKHHPAVLSWYTYDEAFTTDWGKKHYAEILDTIARGQATDPYHPVVMLENLYGMDYARDKKLFFPGKIPTLDVYAYPPGANVQILDSASSRILEMGEQDGRPGWFVAFASGYAFHASRDMTPPEHEYMAYICMINGIRGMFYWAAYPKAPTSFRTLMRIFRELDSLKEILFSLEDAPKISCNSNNIKYTVRKHEGKVYLITVNETRDPVKTKFDLSGIPGAETAEVLFENRKLSLRNSCLEDNWEGLQRHVYLIR